MNKALIVFLIVLNVLLLGIGAYTGIYYFTQYRSNIVQVKPNFVPVPTEKPLEKFTFDNLSKREYRGSQIEIDKQLNTETEAEDRYKSHLFFFVSDGKRVSGQINIPLPPTASDSAQEASESALLQIPLNGKYPVLVMLRGFVDRDMYESGIGTKRAAGVFAQNGYITLAPDFLGYGKSDMPENDVWWERFNNPVQVLNLLASIKTLDQADPEKIGIWAHSNGGQIALSVLEISRQNIPTTLWAPVTKPFPFAILFFTDEFEDEGKALRAEVARLENDYDARQYSISDYFDLVQAPLQIHQGGADDAVPLKWSNEFVKKLKELKKNYKYYTYPYADHNMAGSWNQVVERDLIFFEKYVNSPIQE